MEEGYKEYIGSPAGTTIIKVKRKKKGMSAKMSGKPFELLHVGAMIIEAVQGQTGADKSEIVGALLEIIYQDDVEEVVSDNL